MAGFWRWLLGVVDAKPTRRVAPRQEPPRSEAEERRLMEERLLRQVGGRLAKPPARHLPLETPTQQKMARVVVQLWLHDSDG